MCFIMQFVGSTFLTSFRFKGYINYVVVSADPSATCLPGQFRCPEGQCIPSLAVCNYQKDCEKGEDEFQGCCKCHFVVYRRPQKLISKLIKVEVCVYIRVSMLQY